MLEQRAQLELALRAERVLFQREVQRLDGELKRAGSLLEAQREGITTDRAAAAAMITALKCEIDASLEQVAQAQASALHESRQAAARAAETEAARASVTDIEQRWAHWRDAEGARLLELSQALERETARGKHAELQLQAMAGELATAAEAAELLSKTRDEKDTLRRKAVAARAQLAHLKAEILGLRDELADRATDTESARAEALGSQRELAKLQGEAVEAKERQRELTIALEREADRADRVEAELSAALQAFAAETKRAADAEQAIGRLQPDLDQCRSDLAEAQRSAAALSSELQQADERAAAAQAAAERVGRELEAITAAAKEQADATARQPDASSSVPWVVVAPSEDPSLPVVGAVFDPPVPGSGIRRPVVRITAGTRVVDWLPAQAQDAQRRPPATTVALSIDPNLLAAKRDETRHAQAAIESLYDDESESLGPAIDSGDLPGPLREIAALLALAEEHDLDDVRREVTRCGLVLEDAIPALNAWAEIKVLEHALDLKDALVEVDNLLSAVWVDPTLKELLA